MKISKLLAFLLGLSGFFRMGITEEGGGGALDMNSAADAFSSLDGDDGHEEKVTPAGESADDAAARLAVEDADAEPAADDPPAAADAITVEIDGKLVTLTREQIAENHKNGMRQADYTQKTMAAAEARKAAEAETAKARADRATYAQQLNNFAITTDGAIREQEALLTDQLLQDSPLEYLAIERTVKQRQAQLVEAQSRLKQLSTEHQQEQEAQHREHIQDQQQQLLAKLPEWKDPVKANAEVAAMKDYLGKQGFSAEESVFPDHRLVLLARDAMRYSQLMERAKGAVKKVAALPVKPERPGNAEGSRPDGRTTAMKRLGQTGSINDAAAAFAALG